MNQARREGEGGGRRPLLSSVLRAPHSEPLLPGSPAAALRGRRPVLSRVRFAGAAKLVRRPGGRDGGRRPRRRPAALHRGPEGVLGTPTGGGVTGKAPPPSCSRRGGHGGEGAPGPRAARGAPPREADAGRGGGAA